MFENSVCETTVSQCQTVKWLSVLDRACYRLCFIGVLKDISGFLTQGPFSTSSVLFLLLETIFSSFDAVLSLDTQSFAMRAEVS